MQEATDAFRKAIEAFQTGKPTESSIREAQNWLEAAQIKSTSEEERDNIRLWECYASCLINEYGKAYEDFWRANASREITQELAGNWHHHICKGKFA